MSLRPSTRPNPALTRLQVGRLRFRVEGTSRSLLGDALRRLRLPPGLAGPLRCRRRRKAKAKAKGSSTARKYDRSFKNNYM